MNKVTLTWKGMAVRFLSLVASTVKVRLTSLSRVTLPICSLRNVVDLDSDLLSTGCTAGCAKNPISTSVAMVGFCAIMRICLTISSGWSMLTVPWDMEEHCERASIAHDEPSMPSTDIAVCAAEACSPIYRGRGREGGEEGGGEEGGEELDVVTDICNDLHLLWCRILSCWRIH